MKSHPAGDIEALEAAATVADKRVILSMGGKGGVGKTSVMAALVEWFDENQIPVRLLDLDTENKARGALAHFFGERAPKVNIHTPAGLDAFVDHLADGAPVILADMGAGVGSGHSRLVRRHVPGRCGGRDCVHGDRQWSPTTLPVSRAFSRGRLGCRAGWHT